MTDMDENILNQITTEIIQKYPAFKNAIPECTTQSDNTFRVIYRSVGTTPNGITVPLILQVIIDKRGNILKHTMSR